MAQKWTKFPFKYFLGIIKALEKEGALPTWQIARAIDSCISDASEVTRMLQYLTHYGKIVSNPEKGKWRIIRKNIESEPLLKDFHVKYIQKYVDILDVLTAEPQSAEELANKTSLELNELKEALLDLSLLSEKGYIQLQGKGPRQQWSLSPWQIDFL